MEKVNQNIRESNIRNILLIALILIALVFARGIYSLETKTTAEIVPSAYAEVPVSEGSEGDDDCEGEGDCD